MSERAVAAVSLLAVVIAGGLVALRVSRASGGGAIDPGPPFALVDAATGRPFTERDLLEQPTALFFGFTACPDVCPTGLSVAARWLRALGPDAARLRFAFVTVDPERDTAERMAAYVGAFSAPIMGVTGPRPEIDRIVARFGVSATKVPQGDSYTFDHTALVLLVDRHGALVGTMDFHDDQDLALRRLRALAGVPAR